MLFISHNSLNSQSTVDRTELHTASKAIRRSVCHYRIVCFSNWFKIKLQAWPGKGFLHFFFSEVLIWWCVSLGYLISVITVVVYGCVSDRHRRGTDMLWEPIHKKINTAHVASFLWHPFIAEDSNRWKLFPGVLCYRVKDTNREKWIQLCAQFCGICSAQA